MSHHQKLQFCILYFTTSSLKSSLIVKSSKYRLQQPASTLCLWNLTLNSFSRSSVPATVTEISVTWGHELQTGPSSRCLVLFVMTLCAIHKAHSLSWSRPASDLSLRFGTKVKVRWVTWKLPWFFPEQPRTTEDSFTSISVQMYSLANRFLKHFPGHHSPQQITWTHCFLLGVVFLEQQRCLVQSSSQRF